MNWLGSTDTALLRLGELWVRRHCNWIWWREKRSKSTVAAAWLAIDRIKSHEMQTTRPKFENTPFFFSLRGMASRLTWLGSSRQSRLWFFRGSKEKRVRYPLASRSIPQLTKNLSIITMIRQQHFRLETISAEKLN